jgi:hypothetical protein
MNQSVTSGVADGFLGFSFQRYLFGRFRSTSEQYYRYSAVKSAHRAHGGPLGSSRSTTCQAAHTAYHDDFDASQDMQLITENLIHCI